MVRHGIGRTRDRPPKIFDIWSGNRRCARWSCILLFTVGPLYRASLRRFLCYSSRCRRNRAPDRRCGRNLDEDAIPHCVGLAAWVSEFRPKMRVAWNIRMPYRGSRMAPSTGGENWIAAINLATAIRERCAIVLKNSLKNPACQPSHRLTTPFCYQFGPLIFCWNPGRTAARPVQKRLL